VGAPEARAVPTWIHNVAFRRFGIRVSSTGVPLVGEESDGWRVDGECGLVVVQRYPSWRRASEIAWVHGLVRQLQTRIHEAVAALTAVDGATVVEAGGGFVSIFPFIRGEHLDVDDRSLRRQAAALLARIHLAGLDTSPPPRPPSGPDAPSEPASALDPPELWDADLDAWEADLHEHDPIRGLIHGDFYARNIICRDGAIEGVVDWLEMRPAPLVTELGWTLWEFCQTEDDDLDRVKAKEFLGAYRAADGPVSPNEDAGLIQAIRRRLRAEVRISLAAERADDGRPIDLAYRNAEIQAFSKLRDMPFP